VNTAELLSGLQTNSPVDGCNGLACVGNTACVIIEQAFVGAGNVTDHIQGFDVTATANGNQAGTEVASAANIYAAIGGGASDSNVRLTYAAVAVSSNQLLVANSGSGTATDELLLVNTSTNAVTLAKSKAAELSDIGDTDVGYTAVAYQASNNTVYLWNHFGATQVDDILKVTNGGTGTLSSFVTDTAVEADSDYTGNAGANLNMSNGAMVVIGNTLYWNEFTTLQTFKMALPGTAAVSDWAIY
jgi:hypothetical protein